MEVAHIKPSMATKHLPIIPELWEAEAGPSVPVQPELHGALSNQGYKLHLRVETFQLPLDPQFTFSLYSHPLYFRTATGPYWKKGKRGTLEILV